MASFHLLIDYKNYLLIFNTLFQTIFNLNFIIFEKKLLI